jgi:hypothetical protein
VAYPEKLYFVGELTGMTAFSPKMVRKRIPKKNFIKISTALRIIWFVFWLVIWHLDGIFNKI